MGNIFVNLKRFDIPRALGGVCPQDQPTVWMESVIDESVRLGLGERSDLRVTFFVPEGLISTAVSTLGRYNMERTRGLAIGSQGVFREDVQIGGNFGAFTTNLTACAAKNLGCSWSMIGHSEERKDKLGLLSAYDPSIDQDPDRYEKAASVVDSMINQEVLRALESGLDVLLCIGETADERGDGDFSHQKPRIESVIQSQLVRGLAYCKEYLKSSQIVIGYEPIWAIGPGKTPPGEDYIRFVSQFIRDITMREFGIVLDVVYGGGLKTENAAMIGNISSIAGGLVALTSFTGEIGFSPKGLGEIIDQYAKSDKER